MRHTLKNRKHRTRRNHHPYHKPILVGLIFANWCGHCQSLKPHWASMKKSLANHPTFKKFGAIIEIEDSDTKKEHKIANINATVKGEKLVANGYPTIFKKKGGAIEYYGGEREANALTSWATNNGQAGGYILRHGSRTRNVTKKTKNRK